ncbi:nuclear transport factor 2 family protein [uncultured Ferrimonas sp.]|uniref:YybH family protein n=1 Tax=uncultured Ferrimonas sp. TaxID=432640 RepID=UPI0026341EAD|nr:nuclear transport factor 2 family protein [uncultured Ferrimonas sp.]
MATSDNDSINNVYQRFTQAHQELDVATLKQQYHNDALMMGISDKQPFVDGRNDILAAYNKWFTKVEKRDASIEIRFRCSNRIVHDDIVIDAGYYQMRYRPPHDSGEPTSQFGGKFLFTFMKNEQGQWQILADSSNRVQQELFLQSKPVAGLVYDDAFETMPSPVVKPKKP